MSRKSAARTAATRAVERPAPPASAVMTTTAAVAAPTPPENPNQIAERAYYIWLRKGRPVGQDEQNWLEAIAEMQREQTP